MGDIIANFAGFTVLLYVAIRGLIEFIYYKDLLKSLGINRNSNDALIIGKGHTKTMKYFKKACLSSMIVGFVTAVIFLYQGISKIIIYIRN